MSNPRLCVSRGEVGSKGTVTVRTPGLPGGIYELIFYLVLGIQNGTSSNIKLNIQVQNQEILFHMRLFIWKFIGMIIMEVITFCIEGLIHIMERFFGIGCRRDIGRILFFPIDIFHLISNPGFK